METFQEFHDESSQQLGVHESSQKTTFCHVEAPTYPLKKAEGDEPEFPTWEAAYEKDTVHICVAYIGIQPLVIDSSATGQATFKVQEWLDAKDGPEVFDCFKVIKDGESNSTKIWACYWTNETSYHTSLKKLCLPEMHASLTDGTSVGLWRESFKLQASRMETSFNFSGLDYKPSLTRLPGIALKKRSSSTYHGPEQDHIGDPPNAAIGKIPTLAPLPDAGVREPNPHHVHHLIDKHHFHGIHPQRPILG